MIKFINFIHPVLFLCATKTQSRLSLSLNLLASSSLSLLLMSTTTTATAEQNCNHYSKLDSNSFQTGQNFSSFLLSSSRKLLWKLAKLSSFARLNHFHLSLSLSCFEIPNLRGLCELLLFLLTLELFTCYYLCWRGGRGTKKQLLRSSNE